MSVKKVFAIIGIVMGAVTAFVGAVLGVMAAMGKFKTPVVKPEKIYFKNPEQVIVAQYKDDKGKDVIYSFMLSAENNSIDHEVNVKDCFIWFEKGVGEDLIELCDKDGNLLKADNKKRYQIQCNEKIYYKLKPVNENVALDPTDDLNGKVVLKARTADELHNAEQDLVIWIDRNVTSIFLDDGSNPDATNDPVQEQRINIGVDYEVEFNYVVNPEISWQPISKESKKIVELYYDDPKTEDFVLVNPENIANEVDYSLYKIFDKTKSVVDPLTGELKLVFVSDTVTNGNAHYFKLAIFPSYKAREEFLADENNLTITNVKRLEDMVVTDLYVQVVNTSIDEVSMSDGTVNLSLFTSGNFVYLNNGDKLNNLNIEMKNNNEVLDVRLDEIGFDLIAANRLYGYPKFVLGQDQQIDVREIDFSNFEDISYDNTENIIVLSNDVSTFEIALTSSIVIKDYMIIDKLTYQGNNYFCNNGIALVYIGDDETKNKVELLNVGSYLDFYVYDVDLRSYTRVTDADLKYTVEQSGSGVAKEWKIVVESVSNEILNGTKNLVLGLLVANNDGKFVVDNLFATKPVSVNVEDLSYTVKNSSAALDLIASSTGYVPHDDLEFKHFIDVNAGTYNACVLVISEDEIFEGVEPDRKDVSIVDYINVYYEKYGKKYYIVGYFDEEDNFINSVRTKNNENITKETINKLNLMQLTNGFDEDAEHVIKRAIEGFDISTGVLLNDSYVQDVINQDITVKQNLQVDSENITFDVVVDNLATNPTGLYAGTDNHTIKITSSISDVITRVYNFYNISLASVGSNVDNNDVYILNNYQNNARIVGVNCAGDTLILNVNIGEMLSNDVNVNIGLANIFAEGLKSKTLYSFKIESSAPSEIRYYYGDSTKFITLGENETKAPSVKLKITWGADYVYKWYIGETELTDDIKLNKSLTQNDYNGFQDPDFKTGHKITYGVSGNSINIVGDDTKELVVVGNLGDTYLIVTIAGVTKYLKIEIEAENFKLEQVKGVISGDTGTLGDIISYTYDADGVGGNSATSIYDVVVEKNYLDLTNFIAIHQGNTLTCEPITNGFSFKNGTTEIFNIERKLDGTDYDWVFTRTNDFYSALSVRFDVVTKTGIKDVLINFEQDVVHELNAMAWGTEVQLYAGTTVQLYEIATANAGNFIFETEALIKIRNKGTNSIKVKQLHGTDGEGNPVYNEVLSDRLKVDNSDYTFGIFVTKGSYDIWIVDYTFKVVPNVIVKQDNSKNNTLSSGSSLTVTDFDFINLCGYPDIYEGGTLVYGLTKDDNDKVILYSAEKNLKLIDMNNVEFSSTDDIVTKNSNDTNVITDWLINIGEEKEVEVNVLSSSVKVGSFKVIIKNNFKVSTEDANITANNVLNIMAMKDIANSFAIDGNSNFKLNKIEWEYPDGTRHTYSSSNGELKIPAINSIHKNIALGLEFVGTGDYADKTLTFNGVNINNKDLTINIVPFEFEKSSTVALSENEFNVLTGVYNVNNINNYYNYIKVLSIKDENGNSLTSSNLGEVYNGSSDDGLIITFNKIFGDKVKAFIEYEVEFKTGYGTGLKFTYVKEINLWNKQELIVNCPEVSDKLKYSEINLVNFVTNQEETYSDVRFEPVVVNKNNDATINLLQDGSKFIRRFAAINRIDNTNADIEIENLYVLAYYNAFGVNSYASLVSSLIDIQNGIIKFPKTQSAFSGIIAFRLVTKTGNFKDYFVYVTSTGANVSVSNNADGYINAEYDNDEDPKLTISNIVDANKSLINLNKTFANKFGVTDLSKVDMYLLNATTLVDDNAFNEYIVEETTSGTGAEAITYSGVRYSEVKNCTLDITEFTTLTLSLIYDDGYSTYPIGILTLYLRPDRALTGIPGGENANDGMYNGKFVYNIDANFTEIGFPLNTLTCSDVGITDNEMYSINATNSSNASTYRKIIIKKKVIEAYTFTVSYIHAEGYTIKVTYTVQPVEIKTGSTITVGELFVGDSDTETKFNNTFVIDPTNYDRYFGTYQGEIKIGGATFVIDSDYKFSGATGQSITGVKDYSISAAGALTLEFEQTLSDAQKEIIVEYTKLADSAKKTQTYIFNVKAGVHIEAVSTDDSGANSAQRMKTTFNSFESEIGSKVSITKTSIDSGNGVKYVVGGYTIYINDGSGKLEFVFSDAEDAKTGLSYNDYNLNSTLVFDGSYSTLDFVHLPKEVNLETTFKISNGSGYYIEGTADLSRILYLTISQTYLQVEAVYSTNANNVKDSQEKNVTYSPKAENVVKGWSTINLSPIDYSLQTYLFTTESTVDPSIKNKTKLKLKCLDSNGREQYIYDNFASMGFTDKDNPNFIDFSLGDGAKATLIRNSDKTQEITFDNSISQNQTCNVYLDNSVGMPTGVYTFQIMADTKVDGFEYTTDGFAGDKDNDEVVDYISFAINDDDDTQEFTTGRLKIGTIKDLLSDGVFVKNGSNWVYLPKSGTIQQRKVQIGNSTKGYYIILEANAYEATKWDIYIEYYRTAGEVLDEKTSIEPIIHGASGYILKDVDIILFNTEVGLKSEYQTGRDTSIYGGDIIDLKDKLEIPTDATLEINWNASRFGASNAAVSNVLSTSSNLIEDLNDADMSIQTKTVGQKVNIDLVFDVMIDGYHLNNITYQFQLNRSVQFFFNVDNAPDGWKPTEVYDYTTYFALTNPDDGDADTNVENFPLEYSFNMHDVSDDTYVQGSSPTYYATLNWKIEDYLGLAARATVTKNPKYAEVNPSDDVVEVLSNNGGLRFNKDYTGKIYLTFTSKMTNGFDYTVNWVIEVRGILTINESIKTDSGYLSNGFAYNTGDKINLLSDVSGGSTGLHIEDMKDKFPSLIDFDGTANDNKLKANYQYAIVEFNSADSRINEKKFDESTSKGEEITDFVIVGNELQLTLPIVPSSLSGSEESYLVIYKVVINYLDNPALTYYIAYKTVNNLNIKVENQTLNSVTMDADNINVDERLNETYLDLFYYTETYTDNEEEPNTYKIFLTNKNEYKFIKNNTGEPVAITDIKTGDTTSKLIISYAGVSNLELTKQSVENQYKEIDFGSDTTTSNKDLDDRISKLSVFNLAFNNIIEFNNFINSIESIIVDKGNNIENKFALSHIENGRWGIDLISWKNKSISGETVSWNDKDSADVLFSNKLEDADLVIKATNGEDIYRLSKFNSSTGEGLKMYSNNELKEKGAKKISELFVGPSVTKGWANYKDKYVIGIYGKTGVTGVTITEPQTNWVVGTKTSGGVGSPSEALTDISILVPTNSGSINYQLKQVEYTGDGGITGLYNVKQNFYVLYCESYDAVYRVNSNAINELIYKQGNDTIVDLSDIFIKFKNDSTGALVKVEDSTAIVTSMIEDGSNVHTNDGALLSDNKLTMLEADLIAYKNANPTATYVTITYKATFNSVDLECKISYELPELSSVKVFRDQITDVNITSLSVPVFDEDGEKSYASLASYLNDVTEIKEVGTSYTASNGILKDGDGKYTGVINLNETTIENYFDGTDEKYLEIKYSITTKTHNTSESMYFVILVMKDTTTS